MTTGSAGGYGDLTADSDAVEFRVAGEAAGQGVLVGLVPDPLELTFYAISGFWWGVVGWPEAEPLSAIATFTPRLLAGQPLYLEDASVTLGPVIALIIDGVLCDADTRTPGTRLVANMPEFGLADNPAASSDGAGSLIYDCVFSVVSFSHANQHLAPLSFVAPTDNTAVCLTSDDLSQVPWQPANSAQWSQPTPQSLHLVGEQRAGRRWAS